MQEKIIVLPKQKLKKKYYWCYLKQKIKFTGSFFNVRKFCLYVYKCFLI